MQNADFNKRIKLLQFYLSQNPGAPNIPDGTGLKGIENTVQIICIEEITSPGM